QAAPPGESSVLRLRDSNLEFVAAAKALFGYPYDDFQPEHAKWLIDKKKAAEKSGTTAYWDSILDKLNIETCLANRVALAPYLNAQRFQLGFFVDSFLFPFLFRPKNATKPARTRIWACTSRSRKKFCIAICSRKMSAACPPTSPD